MNGKPQMILTKYAACVDQVEATTNALTELTVKPSGAVDDDVFKVLLQNVRLVAQEQAATATCRGLWVALLSNTWMFPQNDPSGLNAESTTNVQTDFNRVFNAVGKFANARQKQPFMGFLMEGTNYEERVPYLLDSSVLDHIETTLGNAGVSKSIGFDIMIRLSKVAQDEIQQCSCNAPNLSRHVETMNLGASEFAACAETFKNKYTQQCNKFKTMISQAILDDTLADLEIVFVESLKDDVQGYDGMATLLLSLKCLRIWQKLDPKPKYANAADETNAEDHGIWDVATNSLRAQREVCIGFCFDFDFYVSIDRDCLILAL